MRTSEIIKAAAKLYNLTEEEVRRVHDVETLTEGEAVDKYGPEGLMAIQMNAERMGLNWWREAKSLAKSCQVLPESCRKWANEIKRIIGVEAFEELDGIMNEIMDRDYNDVDIEEIDQILADYGLEPDYLFAWVC